MTSAPTAWHALPAESVLDRLGAASGGLGEAEARERLRRHGANRLPESPGVRALAVFGDQFASVVVLLLVAAAVLALLVGDRLEAVAIAAVLALNTGLGFVVELRARRSMEALIRQEAHTARVRRSGAVVTVPAEEVVPGDVLVLAGGDGVPADARLLEGSDLRANEASLTGESAPVGKGAGSVGEDAPLAERSSMVWAGTTLAAGRGEAVVVATGTETELGRIGALLESVEEDATPLERRLDDLGRRLVWVTLAVAAVVVAVGALRGAPLARMVETGIALAIAAVPEGLPAVATIALAVGLARMARRRALVRRLSAVEALGSTTVICTDKTGTLTAGEMTVTRIRVGGADLAVTGAGFAARGEILRGEAPASRTDGGPLDRLLHAALLTNRAAVDPQTGRVDGDPTDAALLVLAGKGGLDAAAVEPSAPRLGEVPFASERMWSASVHRTEGVPTVFVKGAPGAVLERSAWVATPDGDAPLAERLREELEALNEAWAGEGLRVLALAEGSAPQRPDDPEGIGDLVLLGLVGLTDPPAPGVRETIADFRRAGIRMVMITGDQRATAEAIGRELGVLAEGDRTMDGRELLGLDRDGLARRAQEVGVYARVSPEDKLRIVEALQRRGEIVAMLGDGVNDAAALKRADVGVAMGTRGTDVAKRTASVVLQDDRFPTIAVAVEQGRVIFDDIRKFVFYLFSCNLAEVLVLLVAGLAGLPQPLRPLQILWLNLVTDTFPALALAMEPGEPDVMGRPPRDPDAGILSPRFVRALVVFGALVTGATLAAWLWALATGRQGSAGTVAFTTLALAQLFHLGNARSHGPVLRPRRMFANPWAVAAVPLVVGLQLLAVGWGPLRRALGTVPLDATEWAVAVALALVPAVTGQAVEVLQARVRSREG